ncbi:MAG: hypothetical protein JKY11_01395 [Alphaproteobacteria bacterium]|nr:hypothetical protein [Alphaproteobacteria bacterium]
MSLETVKKSLVILDQSLNTLEEVIVQREKMHADVLSQQTDMFNEQLAASPATNANKEDMVQKLDHVIAKVSGILEA